MTRLYLVRHGRTVWNAEKRIQGQLDVELSPEGYEQARLLAGRLQSQPIDAIYSSDLSRARETAEIIARQVAVALTGTCPQLREIDFGRWSGMTLAEIAQKEPELLEWWRHDAFRRSVPGGESFRDVMERAANCVRELARKWEGHNLLVVSHGGPLTHIVGELAGLGMEERVQLGLANCSLTVLLWDPARERWRHELLNDVCHLQELEGRATDGVSW